MAEIRAPQRAIQRRVIYNGTNKFDFDKTKIPNGMSYVWRRKSIAGQEDDENMIMAEMNGWTPVPASRHPELMGNNPRADIIVRGGQMLMEQPKEYSDESRALDTFEARNSLETQIQRLGLQARSRGGSGVKRTREVIDGEIIA